LGSWAGTVKDSPQEVYQKAAGILLANGMSIISTVPAKSLVAELKPVEYWLLWPFKSKERTIIAIAPSNGGSQVTITTFGSRADSALNQLVGVLTVV